MARPALSGSRALQVIDAMAGAPDRAFTLSDLVRATDSNFASCHAVIAILVARGYLLRDDATKTYRLGPALFAAGQAMAKHDPLLGALRSASDTLTERTGLSISISARTGDELVGVSRHGRNRQLAQGIRVGQRVSLKPPIGATVMAWSCDEDIDNYIGRGGIALDAPEAAQLRDELAAIRRRGYLATLNTDSYAAISKAMAQRYSDEDRNARAGQLISGLYGGLFQPEKIEADGSYDLAFIGAPIFDRRGYPLYSIVLSGFDGRISGAAIEDYAAQLTRMCTDVMRSGAAT
ncbi:IclR family transcriptional regulator [Sphingomonas montanisoli]|uniref:Helix-turn-helix domain-containing protein n=1 Tax=Sphingomonas montanisoli TaxID=2606412 RepID=A0A5D9C8Q0_9SPHN|nr:helix-turn-helix domain-containing protein [Sphingomonas montanisoli]TZG27522.1 helix-turn-helix domain-containing protein [Sphingomonas montanisoli]